MNWIVGYGVNGRHANGTSICIGTVEDVVRNSGRYKALRKSTILKEMHIVRYADNFLIFCKKRSDALKTAHAVEEWLFKR